MVNKKKKDTKNPKKERFGRNGGRKPKPIDWDEVDKFLVYGATGTQIAAYLGIYCTTLYDRCKKEKGVDFTQYSCEKKQKGNSLLLGKQFQVAMNGNVTMLVWLGKQRLGQSENVQNTHSFDGKLGDLLDLLKKVKSEDDFKKDDTKDKE